YGYFRKQLKQRHAIKSVNSVCYRSIADELWTTPISDDPEEGAVLKKTIANCKDKMLETQDNRTHPRHLRGRQVVPAQVRRQHHLHQAV
ncbi:MAG: hypothetical protein ACKPKO_61920, partial [Candidatus Fonsibacter sp.]